MKGDTELTPLWHLDDEMRTKGSLSDLVVTDLQMLAWAKRSVTDLEEDLSFFDHNTELTSRRWREVQERLANETGRERNAFAFQPLESLLTDAEPGQFERRRLALQPIATTLLNKGISAYKSDLIKFVLNRDKNTWTPVVELVDLMVKLSAPEPGCSVYCPFYGSAQLALKLAELSEAVFFESPHEMECRTIALLDLLFTDRIKISVSDPIRQPGWVRDRKLMQFDYTVSAPPFGIRYEPEVFNDPYYRFPPKCLYGDVLHMDHVLAQTKRRAVILVPEGFLFRTAGEERNSKEVVIRQGLLRTVIRLPAGLFAPYTGVAAALLVFEKVGEVKEDRDRTQSSVVFIDASSDNFVQSQGSGRSGTRTKLIKIEEIVALAHGREKGSHSSIATIDELADNDFNLSVDRYVLSDEDQFIRRTLQVHQPIELEAMADLHRPQAVGTNDKGPFRSFKEVGIGDIQNSGMIGYPSKVVEVSERHLSRVQKQRLQPGDILISIKGRIGAIGMLALSLPEGNIYEPTDWIAGQSFVIARLRNGSPIKHPVVLFRYLSSPLGQKLLQSLGHGLTVPMIQMGDVRRLPVIVPKEKEQDEIIGTYNTMLELHKNITAIENEINEIHSTSWPMSLIESDLKS